MGEWDVRIISASSLMVDGEPVVELFGKTRGKESIAIVCKGYLPYLYAVDPRPETAEILSRDPEVVSTEPDRLLYKSEMHDVLKITIKNPWKASDFRNRLRKAGHPVLSSDISLQHRFFYDKDMGSCIRVRGDPVEGQYLTDLTIQMESFENIDSFDPGLRILSFDIENSVLHGFLLTICAVVWEDGKITPCKPIVGTEKEIIDGFADLIKTVDPDVITGYNIDNYDITKIGERAKTNRMTDAMPWGRDGGQPRLVSDRFWRVKGRLICDAWWAAKREIRPKQETLNAVALELLGEQKLDVDPRHMDEEWSRNREKVLEYCVKDAELALRILLEVGTLRKGMDLAAVSKLTIEDVLTSGSSQLADSLLIRAADRAKVAVPQMGARIAGAEQIEGGYVHNMTPGLYHWVCVLDFKSMYPSLIIAKNICFTTLADDGEIRAPSGARFMSKERREGLLPRILADLMDERDSIKKRMKAAQDDHEYHYLDGLQAAVKVLMNTFYGVFASTFYRFTDKSIGAAITSFARANVKGIIEEVEAEGIPVIYSDTDSVFMQSPEHTLEGSVEFGNRMAERYSRDGGTLEFEKLLEPMFTHGMKKRYVGRIVWPEVQDNLLIRGYEVRRSDSFDLQSDMLTRLFELILDDRMDEALSYVKTTIQEVKSGKVAPERLVISKTCRGLDAYANPDSMANVQAAKKLIERGYEFIPGMKVSWVVTNSTSTPQQVEPFVSGVPLEAVPDYKYYVKRLAETASRITEVLGWTEKDLMMGSQQATLFGGNFGTSDDDPKGGASKMPQPKPKPKVKSLDDFFRPMRFIGASPYRWRCRGYRRSASARS
ncbi:MAG: DNA polymerase II [Thermoplasmata archaeon]|jgi:DNA polymerase I|nr:DNA polymerase II [Thermoplasmata archaeon]